MPVFLFIIICISLLIGGRLSAYNLITPEEGLGYMLGIIGSVGVLFLLLYSLRKRVKFFKFMGNTRIWFRIHMFLGAFSPVIIVFHSNFSLGSLNGRIALFSMLIVAASGIVGRYFYRKIHSDLTGEHKNFQKSCEELDGEQEALEENLNLPTINAILSNFSDDVVNPVAKVSSSLAHYLRVERQSSKVIKQIKTEMKRIKVEKHLRKNILKKSQRFVRQSVRVAELIFFERLFSLWHILHIPLFFIMVCATIAHIIAVHMY